MILILLSVALGLSVTASVVLGYIVYRGARRLLQFDELFELLAQDVAVNIRYFEKCRNTPLISDAAEIQEAHKNMMIMSKRLKEYVEQMEELVDRRLVKRGRDPDDHRPVVA